MEFTDEALDLLETSLYEAMYPDGFLNFFDDRWKECKEFSEVEIDAVRLFGYICFLCGSTILNEPL